MPRQAATHRFDLFSNQPAGKSARLPPCQALPEETPAAEQALVRMILDHVDGIRAVQREATGHDAGEDQPGLLGA
ncbi:hypothetical protein NKJ95_33100 [Mesorhizobium sp. M0012]|uniref:hypothetical protein n=1 Tax=Mesorhizobium sp. M0012 TaxID=2956840 RepID=UPI0033390F82